MLIRLDRYNSVSYSAEDIDVVRDEIGILINAQCTAYGKCSNGTHGLTDVSSATERLEHNNEDGDSEVLTHHIMFASACFGVHIDILFTAILRHALTPDGMLNGIMNTIAKCRWINLVIF